MQVLYLGRALRTKETLPDFMKWRRVTRHPLVFRRLMGSQRTPGIGCHINRACLKDSFPLPQIDLIVDATAGHELLSFMDTFSGYNQIRMDPNDQEKTSFVTRL